MLFEITHGVFVGFRCSIFTVRFQVNCQSIVVNDLSGPVHRCVKRKNFSNAYKKSSLLVLHNEGPGTALSVLCKGRRYMYRTLHQNLI